MMRVAVLVALVVTMGLRPSWAVPLDVTQCASLESERQKLVADRVDVSLANGPEWAKANLSADQIKAVYRLLELKEQVLFRCPSLNPDVAPDPNEGDDIYGPPEPVKPKVTAKANNKAGTAKNGKPERAPAPVTVKAPAKAAAVVPIKPGAP
jgi:hypothetical protein